MYSIILFVRDSYLGYLWITRWSQRNSWA